MSSAYDDVIKMLSRKDRPTAIIVQGTGVLSSTLNAIATLGLRIPQDISLVSIGRADFILNHVPAISTLARRLRKAVRARSPRGCSNGSATAAAASGRCAACSPTYSRCAARPPRRRTNLKRFHSRASRAKVVLKKRQLREVGVRAKDKIVVVTGGAKGIGKALCERFHKEGARQVIVADIDEAGAKAVAASIGGEAYRCDVTKEADIVHLVTDVESRIGPIDLFCSNAGVATAFNPLTENAAGDANDIWTFGWQVHVMAHVYAARILVPRMKARGGGYFLQTSRPRACCRRSAAPSIRPPSTPRSALRKTSPSPTRPTTSASRCCARRASTRRCCAACRWARNRATASCRAEAVADAAIEGLDQETFLILPHKEVTGYVQNKTNNYDRWIGGMAKLHKAAQGARGVLVQRPEAISVP